MLEIETLLEILAKAEVDFIIVGGIAAIAHGSSRLTQDLDACPGSLLPGHRPG